MTLRAYILTMLIATLICWLGFVYVIFTISPLTTSWIGFSLFYAALFFALIGTGSLVGFLVRFVALKQELAFRSVKEAFRQSFLFASLVVASLILMAYDLFSWLNLFLLIAFLSALELFLISYGRRGGA